MKDIKTIIITSIGLWVALNVLTLPGSIIATNLLNQDAASYVNGRRNSITPSVLDRYYQDRRAILTIGLVSALVVSQTVTVLIIKYTQPGERKEIKPEPDELTPDKF